FQILKELRAKSAMWRAISRLHQSIIPKNCRPSPEGGRAPSPASPRTHVPTLPRVESQVAPPPIRQRSRLRCSYFCCPYFTVGGNTPALRASVQPRCTPVIPSSVLTTLNSTRRFLSQAAGLLALSSGQYSP